MSAPKLRTAVADGVLTITLDDPPANTYSYEMMQELDAAILAARMDAAVHVIVITGAGEKFFCAGANIGMLKDADPTFKYYFCLHANETLNRLEQTPKLVIAALNGHTVGGGLEVAMAADIRIARQGAGKIGMPEVALGVLPGTGGTQRFARLVGKAKAIELMAAGSLFSFEDAHAIGLVNHVWGEAESQRPHVRRRRCRTTRGSSRRPTRRPRPSATSSARCSRASSPVSPKGSRSNASCSSVCSRATMRRKA